MSTGLVYRSARLYRFAMWLLSSGKRRRRDRVVVAAVPSGASVVDLCCGDCSIAPSLLAKDCRYIGLDLQPVFVTFGRRRGLDVRVWDATTMDFPEADVICMLSSLYQFIPDHERLLAQMLRRVRCRLILAEPTENWMTSSSRLVRWVARRLTRVDGRTFDERFAEADLLLMFDRLGTTPTSATRVGREVIIVVDRPA